MAKKPVSKKAEQVLRRRARDPVASLLHPVPAHLEHPPIPARFELLPIRRCVYSSIPDTRHDSGNIPGLYPYLGPRSLRSAQQVRDVPSPHGVSQHEQEGPGSSCAEEGGAAGAWGMRILGTTRVTRPVLPGFAKWTSYLISCTPLHGAEFLHIGTPTPEPQLDGDALTPSSFACAGEQSGRMPHERAAEAAEAAEAEAAEAADADRRR